MRKLRLVILWIICAMTMGARAQAQKQDSMSLFVIDMVTHPPHNDSEGIMRSIRFQKDLELLDPCNLLSTYHGLHDFLRAKKRKVLWVFNRNPSLQKRGRKVTSLLMKEYLTRKGNISEDNMRNPGYTISYLNWEVRSLRDSLEKQTMRANDAVSKVHELQNKNSEFLQSGKEYQESRPGNKKKKVKSTKKAATTKKKTI